MGYERRNGMRERNKSFWTVGFIGAFLGLLLWLFLGCTRNPSPDGRNSQARGEHPEHTETASHEGHEHHKEDGEEASEEALSLSLSEIEALRCEHDVPAYQCRSCRYEVGVVKVPASLLKEEANAKNGLIRIRLAEKIAVPDALNVTGEVQLNENEAVHISPRIPGIIESVKVDIGAHVNEGDVLFNINSVELGKALSDYERGRALTALSEKNFEREKSLFKRRISSEQEMIEAQMAYEKHKTELEAAEQALHVLGLTEKELAPMKGSTHGVRTGSLPVRAPLEGMIIEKHAVVGELVEPGTDVMLLADLTTVWVWADIYEQDLPRMLETRNLGPIPVHVFVRAFPGKPFDGKIDYIGATMEERTRTVKVRATVENTEHLLRPGMFCEISMEIASHEEALAIPNMALLSDEGRDFVFAHWKNDYYVRRPVKTGRQSSDHTEIIEGLAPGDKIVVDGAFLLKSDVLREKMGAGCAD
jgi:cobalt-zinc-cadmium efflux system membrane fusion protein